MRRSSRRTGTKRGGPRRVKGSVSGFRLELRRRVLLLGLLAAAALSAFRVAHLTVIEHGFWLERAESQHTDPLELPAPRGTIYDRDGVPLAASREAYRIAIAPGEVEDRKALIAMLREEAGLSAAEARRVTEPKRGWRYLPGRYDEPVRDALADVAGVHAEQVMRRFYPHGSLAAEVLGMVNAEGSALGGIELQYDSVLRGTPGHAVVRHGSTGARLPGSTLRVKEPVPGRDVVLTIDYELQEIANDALRAAIDSTRSASGELLMLDPRSGEVLAAVSRRSDRTSPNWSAVTAPFEPGSTLKPFTVAALIAEKRLSLADSLHGEDGVYALNGRVLRDVHEYGWLTLADGLRYSSNIVLAKAGSRLDPSEQYRYLRDFGFGTPTGVGYPAESGGALRSPDAWTRQSQASLAIGYEISVTPLQLALAYGALANGGVLMEPRLVREVRARDGRVERGFDASAVRRVVSRDVAEAIRDVMIGVVETGTGRAASMGPFKLAGKTGTAKIVVGGRYEPGAYNATFAGFFPAVDAQIVFVVKLDRPKGAYYGGTTAAPVTRATLEAALAARGTPIDRTAVATRPPAPPAHAASGVMPVRSAASQAVPWRDASAAVPGGADETTDGRVPELRGLSLRDAAARLWAAGYAVRVEGAGAVLRTDPREGSALGLGRLVRVIGSGR